MPSLFEFYDTYVGLTPAQKTALDGFSSVAGVLPIKATVSKFTELIFERTLAVVAENVAGGATTLLGRLSTQTAISLIAERQAWVGIVAEVQATVSKIPKFFIPADRQQQLAALLAFGTQRITDIDRQFRGLLPPSSGVADFKHSLLHVFGHLTHEAAEKILGPAVGTAITAAASRFTTTSDRINL